MTPSNQTGDSMIRLLPRAYGAILYRVSFFNTGQTSWTISSPGDKVKASVQLADLGGTGDYPAAAGFTFRYHRAGRRHIRW